MTLITTMFTIKSTNNSEVNFWAPWHKVYLIISDNKGGKTFSKYYSGSESNKHQQYCWTNAPHWWEHMFYFWNQMEGRH